MFILDDKTPNKMQADDHFVFPQIDTEDDIAVRASYVIAGRVSCKKISALFDFVVLGDLEAEEMDVKGQFICLGECKIRGRAIVQGDIIANTLKAGDVHCDGKVTAQKLNVQSILCEETILVGKTLFVQDLAKAYGNVLCGETIYGAGKVIATRIVTAEELDLDNGESALEAPYRYLPTPTLPSSELAESERQNLIQRNYFVGYIDGLLQSTDNPYFCEKLSVWKSALIRIKQAFDANISHFTDIKQLIVLTEITQSIYFEDWTCLTHWHTELSKHFQSMVCGKIIERPIKPLNSNTLAAGDVLVHKTWGEGTVTAIDADYTTVKFETLGKESKFTAATIPKFFTTAYTGGEPVAFHAELSVKDGDEWVWLFSVLETYRDCFYKEVYDFLFETLMSQVGLSAKFIQERLKERGWNNE